MSEIFDPNINSITGKPLKKVEISSEERATWVAKKIKERGELKPVSEEEAVKIRKGTVVNMEDAGEQFPASDYWDRKDKEKRAKENN